MKRTVSKHNLGETTRAKKTRSAQEREEIDAIQQLAAEAEATLSGSSEEDAKKLEDKPAPGPGYSAVDPDELPATKGDHKALKSEVEGIRDRRISGLSKGLIDHAAKITRIDEKLNTLSSQLEDLSGAVSKLDGMSRFSYAVCKKMADGGAVPGWHK